MNGSIMAQMDVSRENFGVNENQIDQNNLAPRRDANTACCSCITGMVDCSVSSKGRRETASCSPPAFVPDHRLSVQSMRRLPDVARDAAWLMAAGCI